MTTPTRGRPRSTNPRIPRQLGRVDDATWEYLLSGARAAGKTFTDFAVETLVAQSRRELAKRDKLSNKIR